MLLFRSSKAAKCFLGHGTAISYLKHPQQGKNRRLASTEVKYKAP